MSDPSEEGLLLAPKFDADGLVTCVATDAKSGELLMVAHMNAEALRRTVESGEAWYFSRSRKALWKKGESSGHTQRVIEMRVDCDQDAVWIKVVQEGAGACHTGRRSCFYRAVPLGKAGSVTLESAGALLYLIVFGSVIAFTAYIWLLRVTTASRVGTHAYVNPIVAVALGAALGGEHVTILTLLSALTIVAGVVLVLVDQSRPAPVDNAIVGEAPLMRRPCLRAG